MASKRLIYNKSILVSVESFSFCDKTDFSVFYYNFKIIALFRRR